MAHAFDGAASNAKIARRDFFNGNAVPAGAVSDAVVRSWQRSVLAGVQPEQRILFSDIVTYSQWRRDEDENRMLIELSRSDMEILAGAFSSQHWIVLCTNARGMIVSSLGRMGAGQEGPAPLQRGRCISESSIGTNAPGCVLLESGMPVEIGRGEHYLHELTDVVCAAAPIFDCHGQLLGVLDVTGFGVDLPPYALNRVQAAALSIENSTYERLPGCRIVRLHHDYRMLHTPAEGIIAISRDDVIVAANRAARQMLHLPDGEMAGAELSSLFVDGLRGIGGSVPALALTRSGERLHLEVGATPSVSRERKNVGASHALAGSPPPVMADAALERAFDKASLAIRDDVPVILLGETGTGKSMFARALHAAVRSEGEFVSLNCSAIPESLAEAELFGYADGAFTGGRKGGSQGKIEQANNGTLFLDEIGDMPFSLQARLLTVLQERRLTRIGSSKEIAVDISVICATHRSLPDLVREGVFREDLYFRLSGMSVRIPALRERSDLPELIDATLRTLARGRRKRLDADVMALLMSHTWPGNVRELHQALRTAVALSRESEEICREHLDEEWLETVIRPVARSPVQINSLMLGTSSATLADVQIELIQKTLAEFGGNHSKAARVLGISRATLYRKLAIGDIR